MNTPHSHFLGTLFIQIRIPEASNLKDRRQVTRSLLDKARGRFNVTVADLGPDGSFQDAYLVFTVASSSKPSSEERIDALERMIRSIENSGNFFVVRAMREVEGHAWLSN
jgi:uncharacterized protein YlxP (DUF503 family)